MPSPKPYTTKAGTRTWRVRFRHGGRESSETFRTKRAAQVFCDDITGHGVEYAVRLRDQQEAVHAAPTLDEVADRWFAWKAPRVRSDRTIADYRRDYARSIAAKLGTRPVITITDTEVQRLVDALIHDLSPKTVSDRHALLHGILAWAASPAGGRVIDTNPAIGTDLPKRLRPMPKALRRTEWEALHAALTQIDPHAADLAAFLLASGWRWSEATALDGWGVDDLGDRLRVTTGRVVRRNAAGQHVIVADDAKAQASMRSVGLGQDASAMVRRRATAARAGLIFTNTRGGQWHYSNFVSRSWRPAITLANLQRRPSPHWLRHTHVVWLAQAGARLPELQSRIGHASIATTIDVYGRGITDVEASMLDTFDPGVPRLH